MSWREARPWRKAFWLERALPASVLGPVEDWAFWRLALIWAALDMLGISFEIEKGPEG